MLTTTRVHLRGSYFPPIVMIFLHFSLACITVSIAGVLADTSYTGPPLTYRLFGPGLYGPDGEGCTEDSDSFMTTGSTTAAVVLPGGSTVCETDTIETPDGSLEVYTKIEASCDSDVFEATLYNCQDSMCNECDAEPETIGHMSAINLRQAWRHVQTCWQFFPDRSAAIDGITFGGQDGLSAQRFDSTTDLSNLQKYMHVLLEGTCGAEWFFFQIKYHPGGPVEGCAPGHNWCPEVNICTPEACPIKDGVAFSGGSTLSCDDGRCSTLNGCEWSDGSATSNYLYWTNLNGNVTLPDCVGITCTGCVISDTAGTNETEPVAEEDTTSTGAFTAMSAFIRVSGIALAVGLFL